MKTLLNTDTTNASYAIIRVVLGLVILPHGLQKLFGAFDGAGFGPTMQYFTEDVGLPWVLGFLVIIAETLGMIFLIAGILTRLVSASLIVIMLGAAAQHYENGFFMNWFGNQPGEGIEFFLLTIGMAFVVTRYGAGKWSADGWLVKEAGQGERSAVAA